MYSTSMSTVLQLWQTLLEPYHAPRLVTQPPTTDRGQRCFTHEDTAIDLTIVGHYNTYNYNQRDFLYK